ncbi:glycosyltransferase family 32 protein [Patellaria atrata CBS 101060]|uniref:Glycosyltransferase family 32 protein n=1 Tax=Patellaria atrata CBS 101060 TaxID=1346257 RepID=A0A9P4SKM4_9PEZI|nr:glycosyltransferase family 32 protein [Patellaria atrata CBS 101060]
MLTFRRAIVIAAALLTFFFILKTSHPDTSTPKIKNASQLPRPTPYKTPTQAKQAEKEPTKDVTPQSSAPGRNGLEGAIEPPLMAKKPKTQISLADLRMKPLRQQLEYQFPYDPLSKFPAYIWQTWKTTPASGEFDEAFREPEASWTILHPTFVHEVITDSIAVSLIRHLYASVPEIVEAYNALPLPVLKADFFRYLILLARGGIYTDIDTAALKSAIDWVPADVPRSSYGMVIGIEADPDREDWAKWYSRRIQFCQWTIQSKPGHPILRDIVANITEETLSRKKKGALHAKELRKNIIEFTGPALWTDVIFKYFNDPNYFDMSTSAGNITWKQFTKITAAKKVGDVIVLPITSFSPGVKQMNAGEDDDPMAFVKHLFEGTWKPEEERNIGKKHDG